MRTEVYIDKFAIALKHALQIAQQIHIAPLYLLCWCLDPVWYFGFHVEDSFQQVFYHLAPCLVSNSPDLLQLLFSVPVGIILSLLVSTGMLRVCVSLAVCREAMCGKRTSFSKALNSSSFCCL
jgi:hypothetical protein